MRAKFKCRRSAFHTTENRIGMNKQSQREREGAKGNGANTSSTHHSFPNSDWHKKLESCANYFCFDSGTRFAEF